MHPSLARFIRNFEEEARRNGSYRAKIGHAELLLLEQVWGSIFQYNYEGLTAEYPFIDSKSGERFVDFMYCRGNFKLIIEVDGYTTHARDISPAEFEDHLNRQNDLLLSGWLPIRFSARQVEQRAVECRAKFQQALGYMWTVTHGGLSSQDIHTWDIRKHSILQMAARNDGIVRPIDVSRECKIHLRTAQSWLKKFADEGCLTPAGGSVRTTVYKVSDKISNRGGKS